MKKLVFPLLFLLLLGATSAMADTTDTRQQSAPLSMAIVDTIQTIREQRADLTIALDRTRDSINSLNATIVNGRLILDSGAVELAMANPQKYLYQHIVTGKEAKKSLERWAYFRMTFCILLILLFLIVGCWLAWKNALLRDPSFDANGKLRPIKERPFSFSRVQLFMWTMIIICCYTYFFGLTAVLAPINATTAILLGCGVAVYAAGKLIDNRQIQAAGGQRHQDGDATCRDFFTDLLSDENGISIHRFQALVFNVVFGMAYISFFVRAVYNHEYPLAMFSEGQFALIGISSAAYLGLKATENTVTKTEATAVTVAPAGMQPDTVPDEAELNNEPAVG